MSVEQKKFMDVVRIATKIKAAYTTTNNRCLEILNEIANGTMYSWAKDNKNGDHVLSSGLEHMKSSLTMMQREFIMSADVATFRKNKDPSLVMYELSNFNKLEKEIDTLKVNLNAFMEASNSIQIFNTTKK